MSCLTTTTCFGVDLGDNLNEIITGMITSAVAPWLIFGLMLIVNSFA